IVRQLQFYKKAINEHLSVRQLEQLVKDNNQGKDRDASKNAASPEIQNAEINRIIKDLSKIIGVKINIKRDQKGKGVLQIPFSSDKEFNSIYDLLKELEN
ncbi:MAG TPA: hypothetical protein PLY70_15120, partial [Saprospiraceae bacterium]|nr:hypothetical protein [Saprospiraceae bacterium]